MYNFYLHDHGYFCCHVLLQQFFAQIYGEAKNSKAAPGHVAIAQLNELGKLQRHYTLNIDGLAEVWLRSSNPPHQLQLRVAECLLMCTRQQCSWYDEVQAEHSLSWTLVVVAAAAAIAATQQAQHQS